MRMWSITRVGTIEMVLRCTNRSIRGPSTRRLMNATRTSTSGLRRLGTAPARPRATTYTTTTSLRPTPRTDERTSKPHPRARITAPAIAPGRVDVPGTPGCQRGELEGRCGLERRRRRIRRRGPLAARGLAVYAPTYLLAHPHPRSPYQYDTLFDHALASEPWWWYLPGCWPGPPLLVWTRPRRAWASTVVGITAAADSVHITASALPDPDGAVSHKVVLLSTSITPLQRDGGGGAVERATADASLLVRDFISINLVVHAI